MNTNFKVVGLSRLGINPKSTASEEDAFTTRPFKLLTIITVTNQRFTQSLLCALLLTVTTEPMIAMTTLIALSQWEVSNARVRRDTLEMDISV